VACSVRVDLAGRLDGELETVVYRVTQEALLNVARHAEAGRLWLELDGAGGRFQLDTHPGAGVTIRAMFQVAVPS
jgi:signal transduction histidine kinase